MSEQNKQIARRFTAAFAAKDAAALEEVVADEVVDHNPRPGQKPGRQAVIDAVAAFAAGFPDLELMVEQEVAEGDLVVQYGMLAGTNTGRHARHRQAGQARVDGHAPDQRRADRRVLAP